jgi:hypothetical protein
MSALNDPIKFISYVVKLFLKSPCLWPLVRLWASPTFVPNLSVGIKWAKLGLMRLAISLQDLQDFILTTELPKKSPGLHLPFHPYPLIRVVLVK